MATVFLTIEDVRQVDHDKMVPVDTVDYGLMI